MPGPAVTNLMSPLVREGGIFSSPISERKLRLQRHQCFSQGDSAGFVRGSGALPGAGGWGGVRQNVTSTLLSFPPFSVLKMLPVFNNEVRSWPVYKAVNMEGKPETLTV